jgi:hypothetical protein
MDKPIPNFLNVFEHKLERLKNKIKNEIDKPKKDRSKKVLKELVMEAKDLKRLIKQIKGDNVTLCPKCRGII